MEGRAGEAWDPNKWCYPLASYFLAVLFPFYLSYSLSLSLSLSLSSEHVVSWLSRLVACLKPRRPGFDPRPVHVRFVVDTVALGQFFSLSNPSTKVSVETRNVYRKCARGILVKSALSFEGRGREWSYKIEQNLKEATLWGGWSWFRGLFCVGLLWCWPFGLYDHS
jgi:hypothetical protein